MTTTHMVRADVDAGVAHEYLIMSAKHTRPGDRWITFWRANDAGYAYRMDWCGRYSEAAISRHPAYYDNRCSTYAVPAAFVLARCVEGQDESGVARRVPNTRNMWRKMTRAAARARLLRLRAVPTQSGEGV